MLFFKREENSKNMPTKQYRAISWESVWLVVILMVLNDSW